MAVKTNVNGNNTKILGRRTGMDTER